ncbi:MAG: hypothetical protein JW927_02025 [Deltaproteobacteria bacterium]|nr:hypothetical protein [Deltaproteobacteria bacterium]
MKTNTDLAIIPVKNEIKPVRVISSRAIGAYTDDKDKLVRIAFPGTKYSRVGSTYGRAGNEKDTRGMGENIDMYV